MYLIKINDLYLCFLSNPKCGSSTFSILIYPQLKNKIIYSETLNMSQCNNNYNDYRYNHCGYKAALLYFKEHNITNYKFITSIRNPVDKIISQYYFDLKKEKKMFFHCKNLEEDIKYFINTNHLKAFYPLTFRTKDTILIRLEYLKKDLDNLSKEYKLNLNTDNIKIINKCNYNKPKLSDELVSYINNIYKEDYIHYENTMFNTST